MYVPNSFQKKKGLTWWWSFSTRDFLRYLLNIKRVKQVAQVTWLIDRSGAEHETKIVLVMGLDPWMEIFIPRPTIPINQRAQPKLLNLAHWKNLDFPFVPWVKQRVADRQREWSVIHRFDGWRNWYSAVTSPHFRLSEKFCGRGTQFLMHLIPCFYRYFVEVVKIADQERHHTCPFPRVGYKSVVEEESSMVEDILPDYIYIYMYVCIYIYIYNHLEVNFFQKNVSFH